LYPVESVEIQQQKQAKRKQENEEKYSSRDDKVVKRPTMEAGALLVVSL